ncbi:CinA family protein [Dyadobacter sp. CY356]|uniref:CinA family protein n=1 Tax=Dyadobacter sp. CY356 TaxID=2906442 RepID=UPI001F1B0804|nr:CinA family protein [Dyadobacter sp. CY356]MCF0054516.1 CinA family protein [Dyadobacter sp. CY356]
MPTELITRCSKILKEKGLSIAFAESATAGRLASEFSLTEDSGSVLKGGLVCYDAQVKVDVLGMDPGFINEFTPESEEVTRELALRLRNLIKSDIQVAVTGLISPGGSETPKKPVGTIFIHVLIGKESIAVREVLEGSPEQIVLLAADLACKTIMNELSQQASE